MTDDTRAVPCPFGPCDAPVRVALPESVDPVASVEPEREDEFGTTTPVAESMCENGHAVYVYEG